MTAGVDRAASIARWWVGAYTRTAPPAAASDRRAEIESDLYEQLGSSHQARARHLGGSIVGRTLRGIPDDLLWRIDVEREPGRLDWHLAHPTTILGTSLLADCLLETVWDTSVHRFPLITPLAALIHPTLLLLWAVTVAFALVAVTRTRPQRQPSHLMTVPALRRATICTMSVAFSVAGLWRFAPHAWGQLSSTAWGTFGIALLVYAATWVARGLRGALGVLDFGKVSS